MKKKPFDNKVGKFEKILRMLVSRLSYLQTFFILAAFALMVFLSYWYVSGIENKHLARNVDYAFETTWIKIEADLQEPRSNLAGFSKTVRNMILSGNFSHLQDYFTSITNVFSEEGMVAGFDGLFGHFYEHGHYTGDERPLPEGYNVKERPWYIAALEANGKVATTQPYTSATSGAEVISYSCLIFDEKNEPIGVIAMNVKLDRIGKYAIDTRISSEDSYGILFDKAFKVIAHPVPKRFFGLPLDKMNDGLNIKKELEENKEIFARKGTDYRGWNSIMFIRQLPNGWYLALLTPEAEYYNNLRNMIGILSVFGFLLAATLSFILLRVISARIKSDELVQAMMDATPLVINLWNKNLQNVNTNEEGVRLFDLSSKAEYLDRFGELAPEYQPDGRLSGEMGMEYLNIAFTEGYCRFEWTHQKLDGEQIPCEVTLIRINYKDDFMVVGYARDLREFKVAIANMRKADERAQILFRSAPISTTLFDEKSDIIDCNQAALTLLGITDQSEYRADKLFKYSPPCQPDGTPSLEKALAVNKKAREEGFCRFEWMHLNASGESVPCEISLVGVNYAGQESVAGYARDLREQQATMREMNKAAVAEASSKAKSKFLATMSHEIRTPMNAILGITEIQLQDESLPTHIKEAFGEIYNSGELLIGIINDILDLSKIEADKMEIKPTKYEVASLINDAVHLNMMRNSKPVEFQLRVDENLPFELFGDELRIKQILNNLLSNAYKYTEAGSIEMVVHPETENVEEGQVAIVFRISDTGQGMTAEQKESLFTSEYSRFNLEANRSIEGTGLGLNIVWRLIKIMNGTIVVESRPNKGSTFVVRLPQKTVGPKVLGKETSENLQNFRLTSSYKMKKAKITREYMPYGKVLIVDDVESNLYVAKGLMMPYGLSINLASNGIEAINKIKSGIVYDIVFMDHMMPKMDGIEATKIMRDFGYKQPIVALTANAVTGQSKLFLDNGFDEFISKPIDIRQLNAVLNRFIRDKQPPEVIAEARKQRQSHDESTFRVKVSSSDPSLLAIFPLDAKKALPVIEETLKNIDRISNKELHSFTINVHALKSALANIGETAASKLAFILEKAGQEYNKDIIKVHAQTLIDEIVNIMAKIENKKKVVDAISDIDSDPDLLHKQMRIICNACADYDERPVYAAIEKLKEFSWKMETQALIDKISEQMLYGDFDEVNKLAAAHL